MPFLLVSMTLLHLITLAMLFIATTEKWWWVWGTTESSDLWYNCHLHNVTGSWQCAAALENDWLQAVQVLMVLSSTLSFVSFLVFMWQLFTIPRGTLFYFTGLCQVLAGLTDFAAAVIYTLRNRDILEGSRSLEGKFGYCFILAWTCAPLLLCSGVLYSHLRKKE
ncbi:epithelial membrane protein 3-like [Brienomyrus brachyistius]|uniref:epithelial membrane protein 3-like n=1 Tax=Brienomyrus brachyistius TaxID=42636 RepID=UPI0020B2261A|nr:epithelial membrane protein 3-like [Brienomyrus brachyistius]